MKHNLTDLEITLDKINHLYANMSRGNEPFQALDLDLLKQYTRQFYEGLAQMNTGKQYLNEPAKSLFQRPTRGENVVPQQKVYNNPPIEESELPSSSPPAGKEIQGQFQQTPREPESLHVSTPAPSTPAPSPPTPPRAKLPVQEITGSDDFQSKENAVTNPPVSKVEVATKFNPESASTPNPKPDLIQQPETAQKSLSEPEAYEQPVSESPMPETHQPIEPIQEQYRSLSDDELEDLPGNVDEVQASLNDRFSSDAADLASTIAKGKRDELRRSIDLNERFLFIRELFDGNSEQYNRCIRKLDELPNMESADKYINEDISTRFNWDFESKVARHFLDVVRQNFGH